MKPKSKKKLLRQLLNRLQEVQAPEACFRPTPLDLVMRGKLLLISVKLTKPCKCDLCGGLHEERAFMVTAAYKGQLEEMFAK